MTLTVIKIEQENPHFGRINLGEHSHTFYTVKKKNIEWRIEDRKTDIEN